MQDKNKDVQAFKRKYGVCYVPDNMSSEEDLYEYNDLERLVYNFRVRLPNLFELHFGDDYGVWSDERVTTLMFNELTGEHPLEWLNNLD